MELFVLGNQFCDYTIDMLLSNKYDYRTVYRVTKHDREKAVLIVYDMDACSGPRSSMLGIEVPMEFDTAYRLQEVVSPKVYDMGESHMDGNICWLCQEYISGISLQEYRDTTAAPKFGNERSLSFKLVYLISGFEFRMPSYTHLCLTPRHIILRQGGFRPYLIGLHHVASLDNFAFVQPENNRDLIYLAPELLSGTAEGNSIVYSLAMILFELNAHAYPWNLDDWQVGPSYEASRDSLLAICSAEPNLDLMPPQFQELMAMALTHHSCRAVMQLFERIFSDAFSIDKSEPAAGGHAEDASARESDGESDDDVDAESFFFPGFDEASAKATVELGKKEGEGFRAVAGMQELKDALRHNFINVLHHPDLANAYGIKPPNGMLLYGPPGCGKSYLAARLAEEVGINASFVRPSDLGSTYIHGSQGKIADLFDQAEHQAPTLLVFDEIDALVPSRAMVDNVSLSGEVNEFLTQLENSSQRGIYVVGTTNRIEQIDPAVLRSGRIDEVVYVPLPDKDNRLALLQMELRGKPCLPDIDYDRLADLTARFTMSDISYAVKKACRMAFVQAVDKGDGKPVPVGMALLTKAIGETTPSVDFKSQQEYERQHREYRNRRSASASAPIGFRASR